MGKAFFAKKLSSRRLLSVIFFVFLTSVFAAPNIARAETLPVLQADSYRLDVQGGRAQDGPKIVGLWATGMFSDAPFKVQMPQNLFTGRKLTVNYQWAGGTPWAGQTERVELYWRKNGGEWQSATLGQGFRDPQSGHLLLFPAEIDLASNAAGTLELRFVYQLSNGEFIQDGGSDAVLSFYVAPQTSHRLSFQADWKNNLAGGLFAGQSFQLQYDPGRLTGQLNLQDDERVPWSLVAHVRFDDRPPEEYPLVAIVSGYSVRALAFAPRVVIPRNARRMSIWFIAFHNSQSYFDSNYGLNYNFDILPE